MERAAVLEVPQELQFHIAPALETGDLDDELLTWLVDEDLLTTESWTGQPQEGSGFALWGGIQRFEDEIHACLSPAAEEEVDAALEAVFRQSAGVARVLLLLDWSGELPRWPLLEHVVAEAVRRAAGERQEVSFELLLDARQLTRETAAMLSGLPLHLRLRCGDFPPASSKPLAQLLELADRTTVQCSLPGNARLFDLWAWAQQAGVRHLDALRSEAAVDGEVPLPPPLRLREYGIDLRSVCDDIVSEIEAGRVPLDYRPLTRMVRRLMGSEARPEPAVSDDEVSPCFACWARHLCNHSTLLATPWSGDSREPTPERCAVWLAEAEAALRLYHRLAQCDPLDVLRLLGDASRTPLDPLGRREAAEPPRLVF